jgi:hypothetical protein
MSTDRRFCPKCGAQMERRLGLWDCAACGNKEDTQPQPAAPAAAPPTYRQIDRGAAYSGGFETPVDVRFSGEVTVGDPLRVEKLIFLAIEAIVGYGSAAIGLMDTWGLINPQIAHLGRPYGVNMIIFTTLGLVIQFLALFGRNIAIKNACMFMQGCSLLSLAAGLYFMGRLAAFVQYQDLWQYQETWIAAGIQTAWTTWFISILYRDIQYLNGEG